MFKRPEDKKKIFLSGIFISTLSFIFFGVVLLITNESSLFEKKTIIYSYFKAINGLKVGSVVQLRGIKVGSVKDIDFESVDEIKLTLSIYEKYLKWIKEDGIASIQTQGVVGDKFIEIMGGSEESKSLLAKKILPSEKEDTFSKIIDKGQTVLEISQRILLKLDEGLLLLKNKKIETFLKNIEELSKNLAQTSIKLNRSLTDIEKITSRIKEGPGTLNSLIYDPSAHQDLKEILDGAKRNKALKFFIREAVQ